MPLKSSGEWSWTDELLDVWETVVYRYDYAGVNLDLDPSFENVKFEVMFM